MMNTYDESLEQYILEHIDDEGDYLHALNRVNFKILTKLELA
jgi:hypothetical protein